ncbi:NB-ARC domain-containing protein [Amycolatopsis sp. EV170708-02-1]|uniref:NB-ARC domain-containing protein n=1 Tax=Amycolatopsis sp. EV170708-02-1 TaxID=2919322 RepID=UPI001F0CDD10|nr:NB-ARC domain-containing protein [Amycolatopsis sp. EV170708-02-1]UMO99962.1 NB-ARC domain-containing protein [Amycolatopsis sp. EV170708-02-1]
MRSLKLAAGSPSITEITRRIHRTWQHAGRPRSEWPARSTVGNCFLTGRRRPNVDLVLAVVETLVDSDVAVVAQWRHALHAVLGEADADGCVSVSGRLPADVPEFAGRADLLGRAASMLDDRCRTLIFEGMPGIGKTAAAIHFGHALRRRQLVDDVVLHVDLAGDDPHGRPVAAEAVLESFLRLLGVPDDQVPPGLETRVTLYQRKLRGVRALVVLDNAASDNQVTPLLPPPTCTALITTRNKLTEIPGTNRLAVGVLSPNEALQLLRSTARPRRVDVHQDTARKIAALLGHHPLALSIIGRHLHDHLNWTLADYLEPLTTLAMEGGLRAALAMSDRGLPAESQRLLRLLAMHPGHDFDASAAAATANVTVTAAQHYLDTLLSAHLLEPRGNKRYGMHDLVRAYANERARIDQPISCRTKALTRLVDHYRHTATAAMAQIAPEKTILGGRGDYARTQNFVTSEQARTWLATEQTNLCAIETLTKTMSRQQKSRMSDSENHSAGFLSRSTQRHTPAAVHHRISDKERELVL